MKRSTSYLLIEKIWHKASSNTDEETDSCINDSSELGSITPLISIYFTIAMLLIFIVANVSSTYIARRELINLTEGALAKAAQELDEFVYYYQIPMPSILGGSAELVPLNCSDAGQTFAREIDMLHTSAEIETPRIVDFFCDGRLLGATVQSRHELPFAVKVLGLESFENRVTVEAVSEYE